MRIALGVVAGENEATIVLMGPAVRLLDADTDHLVDGDDIAKFRETLKRLGIPFHIDASALPADVADWNAERHPVAPVSLADIAALAAKAQRFIVF